MMSTQDIRWRDSKQHVEAYLTTSTAPDDVERLAECVGEDGQINWLLALERLCGVGLE